MKIKCPHCGVAMKAPDNLTGLINIECCDCRKTFTVNLDKGDLQKENNLESDQEHLSNVEMWITGLKALSILSGIGLAVSVIWWLGGQRDPSQSTIVSSWYSAILAAVTISCISWAALLRTVVIIARRLDKKDN